MDGTEKELEELGDRLAFHRWVEAEAEARDLEVQRQRAETFRDFLVELPLGLVVGIVTVDGAEIWGRVDAVGADKLRVLETPRDPGGAERRRGRRVHDVRLDAVVRVVRDVEEWNR
jgi:hypothetical protein